ncbi:glycosyltransferase [Legionella pneumophila]|uniref:glycosyltransferase n=1 Tax=Legionella pneumophila TaxID=446 RepID=UPI00077855F8|nr:glycosyltransferase [Legionella pneumophila]HAT8606385.1 glycosyltransferase [Legionella pneumophila]
MKYSILFNLEFIQSTKRAAYHGGSENDFTVLLSVLQQIGNNPQWEVFGFFSPQKSFCHNINALLVKYFNFRLINNTELKVLSKTKVFTNVYSSNVSSLSWLNKCQIKSINSWIVIHGVRSHELKIMIRDILLPTHWREKTRLIKKCLMRPLIHQKKQHNLQKRIINRPEQVKLIATSQDTQNKLLSLCPQLNYKDIIVLYTSPKTVTSDSFSSKEESFEKAVLEKFNLVSRQYFLLISLNRAEKNIFFALSNLLHLCKTHQLPYKILACGAPKNSFSLQRLRKNQNLVISEYIPAEELEVLYKHAFVFVYPTRSEGFGMPVLEAMEHGTPVCCSAISPLIELGGTAADYFSLENKVEFCSKIIKFHLDPEYYQIKSDLVRKRYQELLNLQNAHLKRKVELILSIEHCQREAIN